ncbi:MAG: efflux RND transporter permease subunit [Armatimonadetes bacterium]|nr:efflux RND transporter permease subunit [Armatimonadota bacterium]MDE2207434.1 efflux RND transporter permease subunit [Armatimonadota bacterium]
MSHERQHGAVGPAQPRDGIAGRIAAAFINSRLTPLIIIASLALGLFAVLKTPREEEPQIIVPMMDVIVTMPGVTAREVERRVSVPMEKLLWEIPGVEYITTTSSPGQSLVTVRFRVGEDETASLVRLREKLQSNYSIIPPGASLPIIKARSIDDVPVLAITLHSANSSAYQLRLLASRLEETIKQTPDVSATRIIGGPRRRLLVDLSAARLAAFHVTPLAVADSIRHANQRSQAGAFTQSNAQIAVDAGEYLRSAADVSHVVVSVVGARPICVGDVASVHEGPARPTNYVLFGYGRAAHRADAPALEPAVTISVAKRKGTSAVAVADAVMVRVNALRGSLLPDDVRLTVTRNYGETANEKASELLFHMLIAVVSVTLLIAVVLGIRESLVVAIAIPVTLALTLLVFYLYGYTLNRITLFALIFSIGILVDDAIVVVENIVRHYRMPAGTHASPIAAAVRAVDEVGNPTILATFTVIAAILPMAMVGGLMGPYMRPIPVGASAAMLFSLAVAFIVTPWAAYRLLHKSPTHEPPRMEAPGREEDRTDRLTRLYRAIMVPLLRSTRARLAFFTLVGLLMVGAVALLFTKSVIVKMLPFDNKNEFQIIVDMPNGTTLEQTAAAARALGDYVARIPEVSNYQLSIGTSSPFNFNGLVRHYYMRDKAWQADIQVNLVPKADRRAGSHDIVKRIRPDIARIARNWGVRVKVAEVPPGPPVQETLVAEVYGPTAESRLAAAARIKQIFTTTAGVTDVDWTVDDAQPTWQFHVDREKAALSGVDSAEIAQTLQLALGGQEVGLAHDPEAREDVPLDVRLSRNDRSGIAALESLNVAGSNGSMVPLGELVHARRIAADTSRYRKNLLPVIYVTGDVTGRQESPVYAILAMNPRLAALRFPGGARMNILSIRQPRSTDHLSMKWDGEWQITYEVFRDLGIAFAGVLVIIYILVVGWFQSFTTPLVIMAPIPLTLIGILPAHAALGAFFTATSMIGFIAGAGIIVRNSIILVDFIDLRLRQGMPLEQAVIDAGVTRFRPMLLTAAAVIVGSSVILFDPIFQGLAISLMAGEVASTLISRFTVPVLYFGMKRRQSGAAA